MCCEDSCAVSTTVLWLQLCGDYNSSACPVLSMISTQNARRHVAQLTPPLCDVTLQEYCLTLHALIHWMAQRKSFPEYYC